MFSRFSLAVLLAFSTSLTFAQDKILIASASDLKFAMDSLIILFKDSHPGHVAVTYGSSGKFFEQIVNGAPFDIFFSADIAYPAQLKKEGLVSSDVFPYGKGRIVLWSKRLDPSKKGMETLRDGSISKVAIGNPMHAPYGKRAEEALGYYKLSTTIKPKLVYGENISQAAQFISTGAADIGIIALSIALSPNMQAHHAKYYLIPEESHQPLVQAAVITAHGKGNKLATSFLAFMKTDQATTVLKYFGFTKP
jgi:molybdate transport system substrate-binding protein